ncbi:MAG TPA: hypothetical protein VK858_01725 [Longimicrobiales bacterium]|nr:hypothetical protein [Longimicrobiales bacterium]
MPSSRSGASWASVLLIALILAAPGPLRGQAAEKGSWSIGIPLFTEDVGTVLNAGRMMTSRLHLGIELDLRAAEIEDDANQPSAGIDAKVENHDFALGPVLKWYGSDVGPVVPFLRLRGLWGEGSQEVTFANEVIQQDETSVWAASLGIGAEWFALRQLSVSGYTGFQISQETRERRNDDGDQVDRTTKNAGTFRSALTVAFYFR